jgi:hypothetical protein
MKQRHAKDRERQEIMLANADSMPGLQYLDASPTLFGHVLTTTVILVIKPASVLDVGQRRTWLLIIAGPDCHRRPRMSFWFHQLPPMATRSWTASW